MTTEEIEAWLSSRNEKGATRASNLGRLSALFSFAVRRGWRTDNPVDRIERMRIERAAPTVLTIEQCERLLSATRDIPQLIGYIALTLFSGVRPHEAQKLKWEDISISPPRVTIDAAASKTRRRRLVPIPTVGLAWLDLASTAEPLVPGAVTLRRRLRKLRDVTGIKWQQDLLRHTCASYLLAKHEDAGKVALWLGNSARILMSHYWGLVAPEDAERFFALFPTS